MKKTKKVVIGLPQLKNRLFDCIDFLPLIHYLVVYLISILSSFYLFIKFLVSVLKSPIIGVPLMNYYWNVSSRRLQIHLCIPSPYIGNPESEKLSL